MEEILADESIETTVRAWLAQRSVTDLPEHHVARALGVLSLGVVSLSFAVSHVRGKPAIALIF